MMKRIALLYLFAISSSAYLQDKCFHLPSEFNENCSPVYCLMQDSDSCAVYLKSFDLYDFYGSFYSIEYDSIVPYYNALYEIGQDAIKRVNASGQFKYRMKVYFAKGQEWVEHEGELQIMRSYQPYKTAADYPQLKTHKASRINAIDYRYKQKISAYQESEDWRIWSFPFYKISSEITSYNSTDLKQMTDENLNTVWIGQQNQTFNITVNYENGSLYGSAYNFFGVLNIFNGNCRSTDLWKQCARIKTIKIAYNQQDIGLIELEDTWHLQTVDIGTYFKNTYAGKNLDAKNELKNGDQLNFEILDVYPGTRFAYVACSEFLMEGAKN